MVAFNRIQPPELFKCGSLILIFFSFYLPLHLFLLLLAQFNHLPLRPLLLKLQLLLYFDLLGMGIDIQQQQCFLYEILLDVLIEGSVGGKTRSVVDFKQNWLKFVVDEDIEA